MPLPLPSPAPLTVNSVQAVATPLLASAATVPELATSTPLDSIPMSAPGAGYTFERIWSSEKDSTYVTTNWPFGSAVTSGVLKPELYVTGIGEPAASPSGVNICAMRADAPIHEITKSPSDSVAIPGGICP